VKSTDNHKIQQLMTGWAVVDVFHVRDRLIEDYREFTGSFVDIHDKAIRQHVDERMANGYQWPDPWLSLNPSFASGGTISDLIAQCLLQSGAKDIFSRPPPPRPLSLADMVNSRDIWPAAPKPLSPGTGSREDRRQAELTRETYAAAGCVYPRLPVRENERQSTGKRLLLPESGRHSREFRSARMEDRLPG
jgi:hypothetical protein